MSTTTLSGEIGPDRYRTALRAADHLLYAAEPTEHGGGNSGPAPYQLLLCSIAACKLITIRMYADRKAWPLLRAHADLEMTVDNTARPAKTHIQCRFAFEGDLDAEQKARLVDVADKCPTHRVLTGEIAIESFV